MCCWHCKVSIPGPYLIVHHIYSSCSKVSINVDYLSISYLCYILCVVPRLGLFCLKQCALEVVGLQDLVTCTCPDFFISETGNASEGSSMPGVYGSDKLLFVQQWFGWWKGYIWYLCFVSMFFCCIWQGSKQLMEVLGVHLFRRETCYWYLNLRSLSEFSIFRLVCGS